MRKHRGTILIICPSDSDERKKRVSNSELQVQEQLRRIKESKADLTYIILIALNKLCSIAFKEILNVSPFKKT